MSFWTDVRDFLDPWGKAVRIIEEGKAAGKTSEEIKTDLNANGILTGETVFTAIGKGIAAVPDFFVDVFSYLKWIAVAAVVILIAWIFWGRKT